MIAMNNQPLYVKGNTAKVWPDGIDIPYTTPLTAVINETDVIIGHEDVNIGSGSATITKVMGNSMKWNQSMVYLPSGTTVQNGITRVSDGKGTVSFFGTASSVSNCDFTSNTYITEGHKYALIIEKNLSNNRIKPTYWGDRIAFNNLFGSVSTATKSGNERFGIGLAANTYYSGEVKMYLIDLTALDYPNISTTTPTLAEVLSWLAANVGLRDYYPYDEGSLISTKATHIHTDIEDKEINITTLEGTKEDGTKEVMFPDGLKRAGNVYDEINYAEGKAIKRIGVVDLGTLTWSYITDSKGGYFRTLTISDILPQRTYNNNLLCAKYNTKTGEILYANDKIVNGAGYNLKGQINIKDSSYTDAATLKTAMSGVLLYYELAEPIEYKLDPVQPKKVVYREDPDNVTVKEIYKGSTLVWANYYGWDYNESTGTLTRIGNPEWHRTLPIQSLMRKAVVADNGTKKFISSINPDLYEDGTKADYSGNDGLVMTRLPKYNFSSYEYTDTDNIVHKVLKLYPYDNLGKVSPEVWFGSFEGIVDKETDRKLYSISLIENMPAKVDGVYLAADFASADVYTSDVDDYRCGSADSHTDSDGLVSTRRGRPATSYSITSFRGFAANRGTGWTQQYWTAYNSLCRLYTVEYCSFNSQAAYNDLLTADGYHQGGLGAGVTDAIANRWNAFNGYNPFIPCGITKKLGNNTGVISFKFADGEFGNEQYGTAQYTTHVPCYRGIENPFGHIWKWTDGIHHVGDSANSIGHIYATDDITKFANGTADEPLIDGYELRTEIPYTNDNIRDWLWDENGDFIPTQTGTSRIPDYAYLAYDGYHALCSGGSASGGASAGLFFFPVSLSAPAAYLGSRLLYTPLS